MDITQYILDDHDDQRRLFAVLEQVDRADVAGLTAVWSRLTAMLSAHMQGEEEVFYPELLRLGRGGHDMPNSEAETLDAIKDHNEIRDAVAAVATRPVGEDAWWEAVAAVNKANSEHMGEEEREGLTDFRRYVDLPLRHVLAVKLAVFEAVHVAGVRTVDKDPKAYVAENG